MDARGFDMEQIGKRIRDRRRELNLTQTDVYDICGIPSGMQSKLENGLSVPSIILFYTLAQALRCDMFWLMTGDQPHHETISEEESDLLTLYRSLPTKAQQSLLDFLASTKNHV